MCGCRMMSKYPLWQHRKGQKMNVTRTVLRAANYFRGQGVRAASPHTSMEGLISIYRSSGNERVRTDAAENVFSRVWNKYTPVQASLTESILCRMPADLFKSICLKIEERLKGGGHLGDTPFYAMASEFGARADAGKFSGTDKEAQMIFANIISRLDDRRAHDFIFNRFHTDERKFIIGAIVSFPETHVRLASDLLDEARARGGKERGRALEALGDLVAVSNFFSQAQITEIYLSTRGFLSDKSEELHLGPAVVDSGSRGNWRMEYDYEVTEESWTYPLIRGSKYLLREILRKMTGEKTRDAIAADLKAAPDAQIVSRDEQTFNQTGNV